MTRIELLREIKALPRLVAVINENEGKNYTNCKTDVLKNYLSGYEYMTEQAQQTQQPAAQPKQEEKTDDFDHAFENAALAFLTYLEQKGVLDYLLVKVKG